jgi:hypothetical protein
MKRTLAKSDIEINVEVARGNGRERITAAGQAPRTTDNTTLPGLIQLFYRALCLDRACRQKNGFPWGHLISL